MLLVVQENDPRRARPTSRARGLLSRRIQTYFTLAAPPQVTGTVPDKCFNINLRDRNATMSDKGCTMNSTTVQIFEGPADKPFCCPNPTASSEQAGLVTWEYLPAAKNRGLKKKVDGVLSGCSLSGCCFWVLCRGVVRFALPYPGRGDHPRRVWAVDGFLGGGGRRRPSFSFPLQTPRSTPVHLPRILRFYVHAFAHSTFSPIPCVARSPLVQNELKEEEVRCVLLLCKWRAIFLGIGGILISCP